MFRTSACSVPKILTESKNALLSLAYFAMLAIIVLNAGEHTLYIV